MDRNEERTYERVTRSIRLMKSLIGDYGGRVMNVAGDGVLALFESAPEALRFAVAIQQELRNDVVWDAEDEPVVFRIGINLGEVLVDDETEHTGTQRQPRCPHPAVRSARRNLSLRSGEGRRAGEPRDYPALPRAAEAEEYRRTRRGIRR